MIYDKSFPKFIHNDSVIKSYDSLHSSISNQQPFYLLSGFTKVTPLKPPLKFKTLSNSNSQSVVLTSELNNSVGGPNYDYSNLKRNLKTPLSPLKSNKNSILSSIIETRNFEDKIDTKSKIFKKEETNDFEEKFEAKSKYFKKFLGHQHLQHPEKEANEEFFKNLAAKKRKSKASIKKAYFLPMVIQTKPLKSAMTKGLNFFEGVTKNNMKMNIDLGTKENIRIGKSTLMNDSMSPALKSFERMQSKKISFLMPSVASIDSSYLNLKMKGYFGRRMAGLNLSDIALKRMKTVSNYSELINVLKKVEINLVEYTNSLGFNDRATKMFKNMLSKKIDMKKIFIVEDTGKLMEPIDFHIMEEQCIINEKVYENGKFVNRFRVDPMLISELEILNKNLEEANSTKYIDDLKSTKESLLSEYKMMKELENQMVWNSKLRNLEKLPKFNFEVMPNIPLMKSLEEFERQYGECTLIDKKNKMISTVLEDVIGDMKKNVVANTGDVMKWLKKQKHKE